MMSVWALVLLIVQTTAAQSIGLPYQSVGSEDPAVTSTLSSAALCSLQGVLGTSSGLRGIGPLTPQTACGSTASVNGQTLPSSGIATIFASSSSQTAVSASFQPTMTSSASTSSSRTLSSSAAATSSGQVNSGRHDRRPPPGSGWVANQNIVFLLLTTFAILAGVTYFLDELLSMLV